ncbi:bifunctional metallophosphatase/5'-nucleotidase [Micropruina sp.]|uniref:bifunctional metallophosphatase/5'-nucleotidase n=1 Tax=Micropruina sp. TaxID=2737536 RepID=UPI0039E53499
MKATVGIAIATTLASCVVNPGAAAALPTAVCETTTPLTLLTFNDFHGRIAASSPDTVAFIGTIEEQRAAAGDANTLVISAGDNVGASLFASFIQNDEPTIELLNTLDLASSTVGNHEFDQGWPDLRDRIDPEVNFPYLGANVVSTATGTSVLPGYEVVEKQGLRVGIVGAVTGDLPSLVSPAGLTGLTITDPITAVNGVITDLKDGNTANGEADVVIVVIHEGAPNGTQTLAQNVAQSTAFANIVNNLDESAQVVINAHTHQVYSYDAPNGAGTRPLLQAGSYAGNVGRVNLALDASTGATCSYAATVLPVTSTPVSDLLATYPRVVEAKTIVDAAIAKGTEIGQQVIGTATEPISRALIFKDDGTISGDDRARESTMSNLVAQMFADVLGDGDKYVIGMQNPGGNRADFNSGEITYAEAAAILPFANSLMTTQLTGAQVKTVLEQQWQRDSAGDVPSRPYLQLGLSKNVSYTYDASLPEGSRITSISVGGKPIKPKRLYTIASGSFLIAGGDNFREIAKGVNTKDAGRADLESWVGWIKDQGTISPSFALRAVSVHKLPTRLKLKKKVTFTLGVPQDALAQDTLDFKTNGVANDNVIAWLEVKQRTWWGMGIAPVGFGDVNDGQATVSVRVPGWVKPQRATLVLKAYDSGTTVRIPVTIKKK